MRKLTPAQQAAAANLGFFPQASAIGQDSPRIAEWIEARGIKRLAMVDQPLVPAGEALGAKATKAEAKKERRKPKPVEVAEAAPPEPSPSRESSPAAPVELAAAPAPKPAPQAVSPAASPAASRPAPVAVAPAPAGFDLAKAPVAAPASMGPSVDVPKAPPVAAKPEPAPEPAVAEPAPEPKPAPQPDPAPASKPAPAKKPSFADLFQDLGKASTDPVPAAGAVDIRKIAAAKPAPKAPPPPQHPSRIWVQVGVGRDTAKYGFDWRKLNKDAPELFKSRKPYSSDMGRTNRLVTGPFETEAEAKAYVAKLLKAGIGGSYMWVSPAGQAVDAVDGK
jgi:hypothetical protein